MFRRGLALTLALAWLIACPAWAGETLHAVSRPGVRVSWFWQPAPGATATLLLFPGGDGGFGPVVDGQAGSRNFLVRTVPRFTAAGLNIAIFGRPDDGSGLDYPARTTEAHLADIRAVLAELRRHSPAPVWLVGTSRGTVSATAAATRAADAGWAGLVLSSSVVALRQPGAVPSQALETVKPPVLLLHHRRDACPVCSPAEVERLPARFTQARAVQLVMLDSGGPPQGAVCEPLHWHGYIGAEAEAVDAITRFVRSDGR